MKKAKLPADIWLSWNWGPEPFVYSFRGVDDNGKPFKVSFGHTALSVKMKGLMDNFDAVQNLRWERKNG